METALTGLIVIMVLLLAILILAHSFFSSQDAVLESWREMEERVGDRARTDLLPVNAETIGGGSMVQVTLSNEGDTKLADFDQWDVIIQYYDASSAYHIKWLPYAQVGDRWSEDFSPEAQAFDPNILNPGEEMTVTISISPWVGSPTTNQVIVATPNGISASTVFTY